MNEEAHIVPAALMSLNFTFAVDVLTELCAWFQWSFQINKNHLRRYSFVIKLRLNINNLVTFETN